MQNFPNQQTPPNAGYGAPPPVKKAGLSKGCIIGIIAAVVVVVVAIVLIISLFVGGLYIFKRQAQSSSDGNGATTASTSSTSSTTSDASSSDDSNVESPSPTSEQSEAIAGGQSVTWDQQEMSWTLPQKWSKQSADSRMFFWRSPGSFDAASLIVSISPMSADFPAEASIKAFYDGAQTRRANGEVDEVRWLKLGGVKGVQFRESAPESSDNPQRLQWMAYRNYKGQVQLINVMLAARGKDFARHEDALYGILYTTNFTH